jgi:predicted RNA-binding protein with PIN domain
MPYIIDGHNLIPRIPGLSLQDIDDELQLVEMLQEFCRLSRKRVEVYFDNAPPGQLKVQKFGTVTAFFIRSGQSADHAIKQKLHRLGKEARNWSVVSSDHEVQSAARVARAKVVSAQSFAQHLLQTIEEQNSTNAAAQEPTMSPDELEDWLKLFGENGEDEATRSQNN